MPAVTPPGRTGDDMSEPGPGYDLRKLPLEGMGPHSLPWWGTVAFMVIEGTTLVICLVAYAYLGRNFESYPPPGNAHPDLLIPSIGVALMLISLAASSRLKKSAHQYDRTGVIRHGGMLVALGVAITIIRAVELGSLNVRWDTNAYGSVLWFTVGAHSLLLLIDVAESIAIFLIFRTGRQEHKHYGDAADDALYWNFIVVTWIPIYLAMIVGPHLF